MKTSPAYILDTSALINNQTIFEQLSNSVLILPLIVLAELDKLKHSHGEAARSARVVIKYLDEVTKNGVKDLVLDNGSTLVIDDEDYSKDTGDSNILACAVAYKKFYNDLTLVSDDVNLRLRAKACGLKSLSLVRDLRKKKEDFYKGYKTIVNSMAGYDLQKTQIINPANYDDINLALNEFVLFTDDSGNGISMGRKISQDQIKIVQKISAGKICPKNKEQAFSLDLLLDPKVELVSLVGKAGCGKTLLTMAAAWEMVVESNMYDKLLVYRPIQPVGNDIGFLPGTESEKLEPWFVPIMDAFETLLGSSEKPDAKFKAKNKKENNWSIMLDKYMDEGKISFEALTYIRGRSINNAIMVIDESQNISKEDMKTILTRAGHNTKIILTGDVEQIDSKYLDINNNGLTYVVDKFSGNDLYGHVFLSQGERSKLATVASNIL